jgi:hypothetical protein
VRRHRIIIVAGLLLTFAGALLSLLLLEQSYHEPNYSLIEDGLYMGGLVDAPPRGTQAVLNLCETTDSYACGNDLWEPIHDGAPAPNVAWLRKMVEYVDGRRKAGQTVYVHCRNGASRSGMVVIAYLMYKNDWTRDEALAFVKSKRPVTRPNPLFMDVLLDWEKELK